MADENEWGPEIFSAIRKYALQNAVEYNGSGKSGSVLEGYFQNFLTCRAKPKSSFPLLPYR